MAALFRWPEKPMNRAAVGDLRIVVKFLLLPKKLQGEWRWLGFQCVTQEFQRYRVQPPEMRAMDVVGWRDVYWADA